MFQKILVCLDGSNLSEQILRYVSEEASGSNKKVTLLNAVTLPITTPVAIPGDASNIMPMMPSPEQIAADEAKAKKYLEKQAQSLKELGIKTECVVVIGDPGSSIVDYAEKNAIDLIAIATHGRSGLRRILFGSVAEYVIKHSKLPILLIKPK
jgi:nucleotide-binding universal stress UspA family protein